MDLTNKTIRVVKLEGYYSPSHTIATVEVVSNLSPDIQQVHASLIVRLDKMYLSSKDIALIDAVKTKLELLPQ
jgi:hypothetical protein